MSREKKLASPTSGYVALGWPSASVSPEGCAVRGHLSRRRGIADCQAAPESVSDYDHPIARRTAR